MHIDIEIYSKGYFYSIKQFRLLQDIGIGSFGKVKLAVHRGTRKQYAIKIIDLNSDLTHNQTQLILREIKVHSRLDHPHIIKLWDTLLEDNKIYMIMDYAKKGSLFNYQFKKIKECGRSTTQKIYQFFYQTVQAIKYLHSMDIMHRDIKPENLLLDQNLNIKLCDFGWSTSQITANKQTFCGTYQYMAPEMVLQKNYDYRVDIWALGVLLYQLVHGKAPFMAQDLKTMKQRITNGSYQLNSQCSDELKYLIVDILQFSPQKRLYIKQIEQHQWIKSCQNLNFNCQSFANQTMNIFKEPKYKPRQVYQFVGKTFKKHKRQNTMGKLEGANQIKDQSFKIKRQNFQSIRQVNQNQHDNQIQPRYIYRTNKKHNRNYTQDWINLSQSRQIQINKKNSQSKRLILTSSQNNSDELALIQQDINSINNNQLKLTMNNGSLQSQQIIYQIKSPSYRKNFHKKDFYFKKQGDIINQAKKLVNQSSLKNQLKQSQQLKRFDKKVQPTMKNQKILDKDNKTIKKKQIKLFEARKQSPLKKFIVPKYIQSYRKKQTFQ